MRMRTLWMVTGLLCAAGAASAANAPVNIVYPTSGQLLRYSSYFPVSFSTTCNGGAHTAEWGFDGTTLGSGLFYDQASVQFMYKLPPGSHVFWAKSRCGYDEVTFTITNN